MSDQYYWERPASVPIPTVWEVYESDKPMPNGKIPRFRIQDYTEDWRDDIFHIMMNYFYTEEPLAKCNDIIHDQQGMKELKEFINEYLDRKMVLIAVVDNYDELEDESLPRLAGCNVTGVVTPDEKLDRSQSEKLQKILDLVEEFHKRVDCFKYYQVSEYLYALGLSVHPAYRGRGLAFHLLKARFALCKATGIKATMSLFTAPAAQRAAKKAGFKTLAEIFYEDYKNEKGEIIFQTVPTKSVKLMAVAIS